MTIKAPSSSSGAQQASASESFVFVVGTCGPVTALALDRYLGFKGGFLHLIAGRLYLPRMEFLYVVAIAAVAALFFWHLLQRPSRAILAAVASGVLVAGGLTAIVLTILATRRTALFFPLVVVPACTAGLWLNAARRALGAAREALGALGARATCACCATATLVVPVLLLPQPWNLVAHLPDAAGAHLAGADLNGIYLDGCTEVTLAGANLSHANLSESVLVNCNLDLRGADLREASFRNAELSEVNLAGADLRNADLTGATLFMTDLTNADLRGASMGLKSHGRLTLSGTDIRGADLSELKHWQHHVGRSWHGVIFDNTTKWPPGLIRAF